MLQLPSLNPAAKPANVQQPKFAGYRGDFDEPGEVINDHYERHPEFQKIVEHKDTNRINIHDYDWGQSIKANLRKNLDAMSNGELLKRAQFAVPALKGHYPDEKLQGLTQGMLPHAKKDMDELKDVLVERQHKALNSIANHALTAEEPSVAPLTFGVKKYRKATDIRAAFVSFLDDEENHRRLLHKYIETLGTEPQVSKSVEKNFKRFERIAKVSPQFAIFLALSVETMGNSWFEFFGKHSPDPLAAQLFTDISEKDERRHMKIMHELYNTLYGEKRQIPKWMKTQALEYMTKNKEYRYMTDACYLFGVDPTDLQKFLHKNLQESFAQIGFEIKDKDFETK